MHGFSDSQSQTMQLCSEIINGHSIKLTSGEDLPVSELLDSRAGTSQCSSGNLITAGHIKELFEVDPGFRTSGRDR